jgi:hypothetical protein
MQRVYRGPQFQLNAINQKNNETVRISKGGGASVWIVDSYKTGQTATEAHSSRSATIGSTVVARRAGIAAAAWADVGRSFVPFGPSPDFERCNDCDCDAIGVRDILGFRRHCSPGRWWPAV